MKKLVYIINGPNLNLLGKREPEIYGHETMYDIEKTCEKLGQEFNIKIRYLQSNHEGQIIDWILEAREDGKGIIINAGAFTHTSLAILDALKTYTDRPVLEVHLTNLYKREKFRHHSYISLRADGVITGCGAESYELALRRMGSLLS